MATPSIQAPVTNGVEELLAHAYDWQLEDNSTDQGRLAIHAWCLNRKDESMLLRIENFPAMCHIELPEYVGTRHHNWTRGRAKIVFNHLCSSLEKDSHAPINYQLVWKEKLYYYRNGIKYPMLFVTFKTLDAMRHCSNLLKRPITIQGIGSRNNPPPAKYNMWQNNVPTIRKLLTFRDCGFAQWFRVQGQAVPHNQKISRLEKEYIVNWESLSGVSAKESKGWITHPKTLSFDIETFSDNYKALPIKYNPKHVSFMISATTQLLGLPETKKKQIYVLGDCGHISENEVNRLHDEIDMINTFSQLIREYDPDMLTGYNIFGYDYDYLHHRVITKGREWPDDISRLYTKNPWYKPSAWASSAYGNLSINQLMMPGRISVDPYLIVKREHKLSKYNLNTVAKHFLDKSKHDVTPVEMFVAHADLSESILMYERCVKEWLPGDSNDLLLSDRQLQNKYDNLDACSRFDLRFDVSDGDIIEESQLEEVKKEIEVDQSPTEGSASSRSGNLLAETSSLRSGNLLAETSSLRSGNLLAETSSLRSLIVKEVQVRIKDGEDAEGNDTFHLEPRTEVIAERKSMYLLNDDPRIKILSNIQRLEQLSMLEPEELTVEMLPQLSSNYGMKASYHSNIAPKVLLEVLSKYEYAKLEMTRVGAYCDQDAVLAIEILEKLNGWVALVEMSSIVGVPIQDIYTRGQQIRGLSLIYDMVSRMDIIIDSKEFNFGKWSGGFVWEPDPGLYENVICLDFKSLYPSIIIAYNICYTTLIPKELEDSIPDYMCNVLEWDDDGDGSGNTDDMADDDGENEEDEYDSDGELVPKEKKAKHYRFKFFRRTYMEDGVEKEGKEGILPRLVQRLIDTRNSVRHEQKTEKDPVYWGVLEQRQLGYKVCANSMYGMLGVSKNGVLPLLPAAMSVTSEGRRLINWCNDYIIEKYNGHVVYNDTDSTMIQLPEHMVSNGREAIEWGYKLEKEMSAIFAAEGRKALYLEFEKAGRMLCIRKKKYAYWLLDLREQIEVKDTYGTYIKVPNPGFAQLRDIEKDKGAIMKKGIILARRDNCLWQRSFYERVLNKIMVRAPKEDVLSIIVREIMTVLLGRVPWQSLTIIKGLGANYKSPSYFMKVFSDELQRLGVPATPGDRLEYVIVKTRDEIATGKSVLLGYKMRLPETYLDRLESDEPEMIDAMYYIEKVATNCIEQLWQVGYRQELAHIEHQNRISDANNILNELKAWGYTLQVNAYLSHTNYDPIQTVELLLDSPDLGRMTVEARKRHVTGRHVFDTRLSRKPIQTMSKSIPLGKLPDVISSFCTLPMECGHWLSELSKERPDMHASVTDYGG